jgi:methionyl-tRNA formyltransferase
MNILLTGSSSVLSSQVFNTLSHSVHTLCAVAVLQGQHDELGSIISVSTDDIELLARQAQLPVITLADIDNATRLIAALEIDVIVVSCYARLIPLQITALATCGCFNVHPSLLPRYRGPEPLFWQFKDEAQFGLTIHQLNQHFDTGAIVAQQAIELDDGCDYAQANRVLAGEAGKLVEQLLGDINNNKLEVVEQDETIASYCPYPQASDFNCSHNWSARHIYNFLCGTENFGNPYQCYLSDRILPLSKAIDYDAGASQSEDLILENNIAHIRCNPGVLIAALA